jgi:hypothetical protein
MLEWDVCRVLRDVIPPTPPGPEGSNGNGQIRAQWVARYIFNAVVSSSFLLLLTIWDAETSEEEVRLVATVGNCGVTGLFFSERMVGVV